MFFLYTGIKPAAFEANLLKFGEKRRVILLILAANISYYAIFPHEANLHQNAPKKHPTFLHQFFY